jgi:hypothetical protein
MPTHNPCFPQLQAWLAPPAARLAQALRSVRTCTLAQLEQRFGTCLPPGLLAKAPNTRDRVYTQARTFWCFLGQCLNPGTACREVVRQVQAVLTLGGGPKISQGDSAYCLARQRLPASVLARALASTAQAAQRAAPPLAQGFLQGRCLKVVDATTVAMPDTKKNGQAYPKSHSSHDGIGFPLMRVLVFFCLASGAIVNLLAGNYHQAELRLFHQMLAQLVRNDILIGDRAFGYFVVLHLLRGVGVDFIGRTTRKIDGRRRRRRLGPQDWEIRWGRPRRASAFLSAAQWSQVPATLTLRVVRGSLWRPGFRVRQVTLVTTLLDARLYPAEQILAAYARRWRLELCFDDLKTTLQMEMLSCQSPAMIQKELTLHLIAYNLIRFVMAQAALTHGVAVERISFKGTLDGLRQFSLAMSQARTKRRRQQLGDELLRVLAADAVPERPNRREPRAVKRQKNKYPRLDCPRHKFRDRLKSNVRLSRARRRNASLN